MNRKIRNQVDREVGRAWPEFERKHPALVRELGREWYVAEAQARLAEEYRQAMMHGVLADRGPKHLAGVIERVVRRLLWPRG